MKKMKRVLARLMAVALATTLVACNAGGSTNPTGSSTAGGTGSSETDGGTAADKILDIQVDVEVASMDAQVATDGTSFEVIAATIVGLYALDAAGSPIPAIA